jgi:hypothetical protein
MDLAQAARPAIVLCPPLAPDSTHPEWVGRLATSLRESAIPCLVPHLTVPPPSVSAPDVPASAAADRMAVAGWVADQAVEITAARLEHPLLLVAHGSALRGLPALAMSQRAARHNVVGYVLVDGQVPAPNPTQQEWPDAPVLFVQSPPGDPEALRLATLRGWRTVQDDPARVVLAHARMWPDQP